MCVQLPNSDRLVAARVPENDIAKTVFKIFKVCRKAENCRNFRRSFEGILALAEDCDVDGIIVGSMMNTAFGLLYSRMELHVPADMPDDGH